MKNMCEESEFILAQYYEPITKTNKITCKHQPFYVENYEERLLAFNKASTSIPQKKGEGVIGRVWESQDYEWVKNVQHYDSDTYIRKYNAVESGLQTCLTIAHIDKGEFKGVCEFFLGEEWYEIPGIVEKVQFYL